jgi:hypothetical protein
MKAWNKDKRKEAAISDIDTLAPKELLAVEDRPGNGL